MSNNTSYQSTPEEARRIFGAIFGQEAPAIVVQRFVEASDRLNAISPPATVADYYESIQRVGDLEALEVACRYRRTIPVLAAKFRIMVYIAETVPELQQHLVNHRQSLAGAIWALAFGGLRTSLKLMKGLFLIGRARNA